MRVTTPITPKFNVMDLVQIKAGEFRGRVGRILESYGTTGFSFFPRYYVYLIAKEKYRSMPEYLLEEM